MVPDLSLIESELRSGIKWRKTTRELSANSEA
jgi:hypothetical protein